VIHVKPEIIHGNWKMRHRPNMQHEIKCNITHIQVLTVGERRLLDTDEHVHIGKFIIAMFLNYRIRAANIRVDKLPKSPGER
jgi:hypothetical protein